MYERNFLRWHTMAVHKYTSCTTGLSLQTVGASVCVCLCVCVCVVTCEKKLMRAARVQVHLWGTVCVFVGMQMCVFKGIFRLFYQLMCILNFSFFLLSVFRKLSEVTVWCITQFLAQGRVIRSESHRTTKTGSPLKETYYANWDTTK